jgi:hypothetical protein
LVGAASWTDFGDYIEYDTSSTGIMTSDKGRLLAAWALPKDSGISPNIAELQLDGTTGDMFVITADPNSTDVMSVSFGGYIDI